MSLSHYSSRFTLQGDRLLDTLIKQQLKRSVRYLRDAHEDSVLAAIWLVGSYGRGEGPVVNEKVNQKIYGDYDLLLVYKHRKQARSYTKKFAQWQQSLLQEQGICLDLRTPGTLVDLYRQADHFYWHSLCKKHQKLWVSPQLTFQSQHLKPLLTLCSSHAVDLLLYSAMMLLSELSVQGFYRVVLAICDSLLLLTSRYVETLQGRLKNMYRLQQELQLNWLRELFFLQQEAVRAQLFPEENNEIGDVSQLILYLRYASVAFFTGIKNQPSAYYSDVERIARLKNKKEILTFWIPFLFGAADSLPTHLLVGKPWSARLPKHVHQAMQGLSQEKSQQILRNYFSGAVKVLYTNDAIYRMNNI